MKNLIACSLLAVVPGGVALSTQYEADHSLRIEIESSVTLETTTMEIEVDGERQEPRGGSMASESTKREVHVDHVVEVKDGKPAKVRRQFEELAGKITFSGGENTNELELEAPLGGTTIEITRDGDGPADATAVEGGKPDDKLLEGHVPDLFLDGLLPDGAVEVGATWELDSDTIRKALRLDVADALFPRQQPESSGEEGGRRRGSMRRMMGDSGLMQRAEWKGKAKLAATDEEVDGVACAVIELVLTASGDIPEPEMGGRRERGQVFGVDAIGRSAAGLAVTKSTFEVDLTGKLAFATKEKRPVSLDLEGSAKTEVESESTRSERTFKMHMIREGSVTFQATVTPEAAKSK